MVSEAAPDVELKARIFISYSRKDMAFADRLIQRSRRAASSP